MSQYKELAQLLSDHKDLQKEVTSLYTDITPILRTTLAEWIEQQNWSSLISSTANSDQTDCDVVNKGTELLNEALKLLGEKIKSSNSPELTLCIMHSKTTVKSTYEKQPLLFARHIASCLESERQIIDKMLRQNPSRSYEIPITPWSLTSKQDIEKQLQIVETDIQTVACILKETAALWEKYQEDIDSKSPVLRDLYQNGNLLNPSDIFHKWKSELLMKLEHLIPHLESILMSLKPHICKWKASQLHKNTCRLPAKVEDTKYVEDLCYKVCDCLNVLMQCVISKEMQEVGGARDTTQRMGLIPQPSVIIHLEESLRRILKILVQLFIVVFEQPPLTMMIEKGSSRDKDDTTNSKKFTTSVGILGGEGFGLNLVMKEVMISLCFGQDLAEAEGRNTTPNMFMIHHDRRADQRKADLRPEAQETFHMKVYEGLRVENFSRKDQKIVYKQLYHAVYDVVISFPLLESEFKTRAVSLPIIVRTGANQASEHIGTQLWHSFSATDVYDVRAPIASSMKLEDVVCMIDERIRFIGGRCLRQYEREFLLEKLAIQASKSGKSVKPLQQEVTLDNFIKEKVSLTPQGGASESEKDLRPFSLWRWLHSVINLLETTLKEPWIDGVIYGFASRKHCQEVLRNEPAGTFLIRFSESMVMGNHEMSKGFVGVVFKGGDDVQFPPPIKAEDIEAHGLAERIRSIQFLSSEAPDTLLGTSYDIDFLEKYQPNDEGKQMQPDRYTGFIKKEIIVPTIDNLSISGSPMHVEPPFSPTNSISSNASDRKPPIKAKRSSKSHSLQDLTPSKQQCSFLADSPGSSMSCLSPGIRTASSISDGHQMFSPQSANIPVHIQNMTSEPDYGILTRDNQEAAQGLEQIEFDDDSLALDNFNPQELMQLLFSNPSSESSVR